MPCWLWLIELMTPRTDISSSRYRNARGIVARLRQARPWLSRLRIAAGAALACFVAGNAAANPTGMQVVAGQVSTVTSGNQLLITNSPGTILNWQSFSIMPGELTKFLQQSSSSSVLNRITGQNPSQILGALQSNGKVFLINPNGIVFGAGSHVDVNGLVASSLNIGNADFLAGHLKFSSAGTPGNISNSGGITTPSGGQVYLIAPNVTNSGIITSPGGDVLLAAGHSVDLADSNDPDVRVVVSAPGDQALNVGKVVAESGRVGVYGALVNQLGLVSANSAVAGENGRIVFKSTDTTLLGPGSVTTATGGGAGGNVQVLGNRVGLTGDAVVDASGQTGGGTVLIGGDTHGNNPAIENAALTYVGPQAQVDADASHSGAGGKVVVWSDQQTQMYGTISARGGPVGGDGGFVETSSASKLDFTGEVDLRAPRGAAGTLLGHQCRRGRSFHHHRGQCVIVLVDFAAAVRVGARECHGHDIFQCERSSWRNYYGSRACGVDEFEQPDPRGGPGHQYQCADHGSVRNSGTERNQRQYFTGYQQHESDDDFRRGTVGERAAGIGESDRADECDFGRRCGRGGPGIQPQRGRD
jgi:filamentous hemagglutinin family protein